MFDAYKNCHLMTPNSWFNAFQAGYYAKRDACTYLVHAVILKRKDLSGYWKKGVALEIPIMMRHLNDAINGLIAANPTVVIDWYAIESRQ